MEGIDNEEEMFQEAEKDLRESFETALKKLKVLPGTEKCRIASTMAKALRNEPEKALEAEIFQKERLTVAKKEFKKTSGQYSSHQRDLGVESTLYKKTELWATDENSLQKEGRPSHYHPTVQFNLNQGEELFQKGDYKEAEKFLIVALQQSLDTADSLQLVRKKGLPMLKKCREHQQDQMKKTIVKKDSLIADLQQQLRQQASEGKKIWLPRRRDVQRRQSTPTVPLKSLQSQISISQMDSEKGKNIRPLPKSSSAPTRLTISGDQAQTLAEEREVKDLLPPICQFRNQAVDECLRITSLSRGKEHQNLHSKSQHGYVLPTKLASSSSSQMTSLPIREQKQAILTSPGSNAANCSIDKSKKEEGSESQPLASSARSNFTEDELLDGSSTIKAVSESKVGFKRQQKSLRTVRSQSHISKFPEKNAAKGHGDRLNSEQGNESQQISAEGSSTVKVNPRTHHSKKRPATANARAPQQGMSGPAVKSTLKESLRDRFHDSSSCVLPSRSVSSPSLQSELIKLPVMADVNSSGPKPKPTFCGSSNDSANAWEEESLVSELSSTRDLHSFPSRASSASSSEKRA
eukprot:m.263863 g.263863  ORF g.263863 m.263863 type:complete len:578 (+) comp40460_c0_seq35:28-1761(+)